MMPAPSVSHAMTVTPSQTSAASRSAGGRLVAEDGRELALRAVSLSADACAGLARVTLEQRFANPYGEPLEVTYQVALPADGAMRVGFANEAGERLDRDVVVRWPAARPEPGLVLDRGECGARVHDERASSSSADNVQSSVPFETGPAPRLREPLPEHLRGDGFAVVAIGRSPRRCPRRVPPPPGRVPAGRVTAYGLFSRA